MEITVEFLKLAALLTVFIGAICDWRTHKIPNKLTFSASGLGILCQAIYSVGQGQPSEFWLRAGSGALNGMLGWFAGVFIMSLTKLFLHQFGHGDTKLVAAVGSFLGPTIVLLVYLYYSLCFGLFSLFQMAKAISWDTFWQSAKMKKTGISISAINLDKFNTIRKELIPVAPFIAFGTLLAILLETPSLKLLGFH